MPGKTQEIRRIYKVFVASPDDVTTERNIAFDVIADLNRIYEGQRHDYRLEVRVWQEHAHPDLGLPQAVINQQISIRECDIFIGVFWKRFGTPPGSVRPNDGRPYLSGTEEEIGIAIEARNASSDQRPVIMLYQKIDPLPATATEEDYLQYAEVIKFFNQCEPGGEHPALFAKFSGDQFRGVLRDHLLKVVAEFESQVRSVPAKEPDVSFPRPSSLMLRARLEKLDSVEIETLCLDHFAEVYDKFSRGLRRDEMINLLLGHCHRYSEEALRLDVLLPPITDIEPGDGTLWFRMVGLAVNPFQYWVTEDTIGPLGQYQVQPQVLRLLDEEIRNATNRCAIILAARGLGKTALCQLIARSHYPSKDDDVLCIIFGKKELEKIMAYAGHSLEALDTAHYLTMIQESIAVNFPDIFPDKADLSRFDISGPQGFEALIEIVRRQGFKALMCLVDQVDAVDRVESQPEKMVQLLWPLMRVSWQAVPGITFRYFLPISVEPLLQAQTDTLHLDRYRVVHLKWRPGDLQKLIEQRLRVSSNYLVDSLGQLCEPGPQFDVPIDQALVQLAEGSPRATIWLANRLIELHCQSAEPLRFIQPSTWEQVKAEWQNSGRSQLFGPPTQREGFVSAGEHIYFKGKEIDLSKKSSALLRCLIWADERGCSKEELIRAGWPGDDPSGVTEAALTEAVRRMRAELKRNGGDSRWVKTVRGLGYRLQKPTRK
jgi:hypothetical protein